MHRRWLAVAVVAWGAAPLLGQEHGHERHDTAKPASTRDSAAGGRTPLYDNLGSYHKTITTGSPVAQRYFDQGLRLTYGFNHDEAIKSFREGIREDPACAMCWWGVAYALGPNIKVPRSRSRPTSGHWYSDTRPTSAPTALRSIPPGPGPSARCTGASLPTTMPPCSTRRR
jgi:hypothetical protein